MNRESWRVTAAPMGVDSHDAKLVPSTIKSQDEADESPVKRKGVPIQKNTSIHDWSRSHFHQEERWVPPVAMTSHCGLYEYQARLFPRSAFPENAMFHLG